MKSSINKFIKGLSSDLNDINQTNDTYSDSMGGSLIYNEKGNYDWIVRKGNSFSFSIDPSPFAPADKYTPIGAVGNSNIKVIFSVSDGGFSEIGIFGDTDGDGSGTYKSLYNDYADPSQPATPIPILNFNKENQIEARFLYENDDLIRVYWVDGINAASNPPRVFTFKYTGTSSQRADVNNYSAVTTSAHSINVQALFNTGLVKYVKKINGNLLTGVYQYVYRLLTDDGYATPWTTPGRRSFITSDQVNSQNYNLYEMEPSDLNTTKGNRIEVKGIDDRYSKIQVCYIYSDTDISVTDTRIFANIPITGDSMFFDHVSMDGEPIVGATISSQFTGISRAKTLDAKDSVLYYGNIVENVSFLSEAKQEYIVKDVTIKPIFKRMRSDELPNNRQLLPLTHQTPKTGTINKGMNSVHNESYTVDGDYVNYKGTQVDKEFSGYWRGETYRYALQLFDNIGLPIFAIHLGDFQFPEQYTKAFTWTRLKSDGVNTDIKSGTLTGEYPWLTDNYNNITSDPNLWLQDSNTATISKIRIMGVEFGGINLSQVKGQVSGYSIVRVDRDPTILAQGLALPCISDQDGSASGADPLTRPMHNVSQRWINVLDAQPITGGGISGPGGDPALIKANNYYPNWTDSTTSPAWSQYGCRANITSYYCPDYDFDQSFIPTVQTGDVLRVIGSSFAATNLDATKWGNNADRNFYTYYNPNTNSDANKGGFHTITKQYYSKNNYHLPGSAAAGYPEYGDEAVITAAWDADIGEKFIYDPAQGIYIDNNTHFQVRDKTSTYNSEGFSVGGNEAFYKGQEKRTLYYQHGQYDPPNAPNTFNWMPLFAQNFLTSNGEYHHGGLIANYVRPNAAPYGGVTNTSLEQSVFYSTGHYQPLNDFNGTFTLPSNDIYNNIEVWGGDCYVDYQAFLRTYPRYWDDTGRNYDTDVEADVAHGICMPYESTLNYSLRQAPSTGDPMYPIVGPLPEYVWEGYDPNSIYNQGLYNLNASDRLLEEFEINGVLLHRELLKFFFTEPTGFNLVTKFPVRWRYSGIKFYGDQIDYWRQFLGNDYRDLNGIYGQITASNYFFNQIYSFQESAFSRLRASDKAFIDGSTGALTTGTGALLDGTDYISTKYGLQHQNSLLSSDKSLYWLDVDKRKAMRFAGDGKVALSDMRGLHTFFKKELQDFNNKDNPAGSVGICGAYDYENNTVMWTFVNDYHRQAIANIFVESENESSSDYYKENSTIFVTSGGGNVIFPETTFINSTNKAVVYYVAVKSTSTSSVTIDNAVASPPSTTPIAVVNPGEYYEVSRKDNRSPWTATQVSLEDITPYKSTITYNEDINSFIGYFPFRPTFYFDYRNYVYSHDRENASIDNDFYVHNTNVQRSNWYGQNYKSYISLDINQDEYYTKTFDSIRLSSNEQGYTDFARFIFNTEKQHNYYDIAGDTRLRYVEDTIRTPIRDFQQNDRTRGKWVNFIFEFKNFDTIPVQLYNLITNYRISNRT